MNYLLLIEAYIKWRFKKRKNSYSGSPHLEKYVCNTSLNTAFNQSSSFIMTDRKACLKTLQELNKTQCRLSTDFAQLSIEICDYGWAEVWQWASCTDSVHCLILIGFGLCEHSWTAHRRDIHRVRKHPICTLKSHLILGPFAKVHIFPEEICPQIPGLQATRWNAWETAEGL